MITIHYPLVFECDECHNTEVFEVRERIWMTQKELVDAYHYETSRYKWIIMEDNSLFCDEYCKEKHNERSSKH